MSRGTRRARWAMTALAIGLPSIGGAIALPAWRSAFLSAGVAAAGAALLVSMILARLSTGSATGSPFEAALYRARPRPSRPDDLATLERMLGWRTYEGAEFDHRVRPVLVRIAEERILERRGIDATRSPDVAAAVGAHLELLLRGAPTRGPVTTGDIERIVEDIEEIR